MKRPNVDEIMAQLKDFQRTSVDYVFKRMYEDSDAVKRFLVADEVGLGKTMVARGLIARVIDELWNTTKRIDIVYICSNSDIARQNIRRLNILDNDEAATPTRLTLLPTHISKLKENKVNMISFTPGTSFDLRSRGGIADERALIYHILRKAWDFGDLAGPRNLFQCTLNKETWRNIIKRPDLKTINNDIENSYLNLIIMKYPQIKEQFFDIAERFGHYRDYPNIRAIDQQLRYTLIGQLRSILAESCIDALEPDLVILDEFQRFKTLLDGDSEVAQLAQTLFNYQDVRVLLLSATPYKLYTTYQEPEDDNHYSDFLRTVSFLANSEQQMHIFENDLHRYRCGLLSFDGKATPELLTSCSRIESALRSVMIRTERLSVTEDPGAMIKEPDSKGQFDIHDLRSYQLLDAVAREVDAQGGVMEYWKSVPYPLNTMDKLGYKLKKNFSALENTICSDSMLKILGENKSFLLDWSRIKNYQKVDPGNAKMRALLNRVMQADAWKLLWIPPSFPYYLAETGPYSQENLQDYTKALVFSSWKAVPKTIAMLCSYEAERQMVLTWDEKPDYETERKRRRPLIRFAYSEDKPTGMANLTLLYPSLTLAAKINPLSLAINSVSDRSLPSLTYMIEQVQNVLIPILSPILQRYPSGGAPDQRWYWAVLALLDREYFPRQVSYWQNEGDENNLMWGDFLFHQEDDTRFGDAIDEFFKIFYTGGEDLGSPPDDLLETLSLMALASPAVVSLRSLLKVCSVKAEEVELTPCLGSAIQMAMGFRTMFNGPETMSLVRGLYRSIESRYWKSVLDYCVQGNLQAVMDEYLHILKESLGVIYRPVNEGVTNIAEEVQKALSIRTINLDFDEILVRDDTIKLNSHNLRCRFALPFEGGKDDESGEETRADQVQTAFNSPFRPFVLASTSIGQEGLDFHQYCHEIYHWNLPSNPVDLEQREGRIFRYKGHVIRKNVAQQYSLSDLPQNARALEDHWKALFNMAKSDSPDEYNDLIPYWVYENGGGHKILRHIPSPNLSKEVFQMEDLRHSLVAYRMVFGQPRQEDLMKYLKTRLNEDIDPSELARFRIDLSPR